MAIIRFRSVHSLFFRHQYGFGLAEFLLAVPPLLLLGLGSIEIAQWFSVRQVISLALLEAGRAGITANASPAAIEKAFEKALEPLFPPTRQHSSRQRLESVLSHRTLQARIPAWQIRIISPDNPVFDDFSRPEVATQPGQLPGAIENAWQAEQDAHYRKQGLSHGRGYHSGLNIYEANTLVLQLHFLHAPTVPGLATLLKTLASTDTYRNQGLSAGYLPIQLQIQLTMQSNPARWPSLSSQKVVNADFQNLAVPLPVTACTGLWCPEQQTPPDTGETELPRPAVPVTWLPEFTQPAPIPPMDAPVPKDLLPPNADEVCGISLCCAT